MKTNRRARRWRVSLLATASLAGAVAWLSGGCATERYEPIGLSPTVARHVVSYTQHAVAADHVSASRVGNEILEMGGNAVDAAVATSFALSVVRPYSCGIGGGGFMVIRLTDEHPSGPLSTVINYRETAPAACGPNYYLDKPEDASRRGGTAVAVPGTVAGLLHALERYGSLDRQTVMGPAIRLAAKGYWLDAHAHGAMQRVSAEFYEDPGLQSRFDFLWDFRLVHGDRQRLGIEYQPRQAEALRLIAEHGASAFYEGPIAEAIVDAVRADGGDMTLGDLRAYAPVETKPLVFEAFGRTFLTMPPPSSGGVVIGQVLTMLEHEQARVRALRETGVSGDAAYALVMAELMKVSFADRATELGGADRAVAERLLDPAHLRDRAVLADFERTKPTSAYAEPGALPEDGGTSHLSVVDRWGNAVACTETINLEYGSWLCVDRYGFALNNEMDDFAARPGVPNAFGLVQSAANAPAPGKRPLSSMSPTIVLDGAGNVDVVVGASGGPRIISSTLLTLVGALGLHDRVFGIPPADDLWRVWTSIHAPRLHHQWLPDAVYVHADRPLPDDAQRSLRAAGHELRVREDLGHVQVITRSWEGSRVEAACDPGKGGRPAGR